MAATALIGWSVLAALESILRATRELTSDGIAHAPSRAGVDWLHAGLNVVILVVVVAGTVTFGRWLGRRLPMNWAHRGRLSDTGSAVVAPLVLGALFLVVNRFAMPDLEDTPGVVTYLPPDVVPAVLVWIAMVVVTAVAVSRLTRRGSTTGRGAERPERPSRPASAWLVGIGGGAVALSLTGIVAGVRTALRVGLEMTAAPLWTAQALLLPNGSGRPATATRPTAC